MQGMEYVGEGKGMKGNRWEEKKERERQRGKVRYERMEWRRRREWKEMEERVQLGFCSLKVQLYQTVKQLKIKYYSLPFP